MNLNVFNFQIGCIVVIFYNLFYSFLYHNRPIRAFIYSIFSFLLIYSALFFFIIGLPSLIHLIIGKKINASALFLSIIAFFICYFFKNKKNMNKITKWAGIEVKEDERETKEIKKENDAKNEG
ncbi:MAG: hypothetical protein NZM04_08105 [Methylacidiphilales bacterium]|nr:hypothetical protein [Candidatus Methylacidiphilales bacterium]